MLPHGGVNNVYVTVFVHNTRTCMHSCTLCRINSELYFKGKVHFCNYPIINFADYYHEFWFNTSTCFKKPGHIFGKMYQLLYKNHETWIYIYCIIKDCEYLIVSQGKHENAFRFVVFIPMWNLHLRRAYKMYILHTFFSLKNFFKWKVALAHAS